MKGAEMSEKNIVLNETEIKTKSVITKIVSLIAIFLVSAMFLGIFNQMLQNPKGTKLYKQDIDVKITDIKKIETPMYTGVSIIYDYTVNITVYSKEFNTTEEFTYGRWFGNKYFNLKKGDIIQAELYTYKNEATGEIVKKKINKLY